MEQSDDDLFRHLDSNESCYVCNGFYGPNFNEPVCSTCHLFLFPDEMNQEQPDVVLSCIKDDGNDSGNDCDCPQDNIRDNSSCCSYNNAPSNNALPYNQYNHRHRNRNLNPEERDEGPGGGDEDDEDNHSSDSLTSDEELPGGVVQMHNLHRHYVFGVEDNNPNVNNVEDVEPSDENNRSELSRRIEELSSYNKSVLFVSKYVDSQDNTNGDGSVSSSIHNLPPEVLISVFSFLDDLSLCSVSKVCTRWNKIIGSTVPSEQWKYYVLKRFPLFKSNIKITNWHLVFSKLVLDNCSCYTCIQHMLKTQLPNVQEDNTWRHYRLHKEYNDIKLDPPDGIQAQPLDSKRCHWMATISGPVASPYEGGIFYLYIRIPFSYPMHPPKVKFITRIFHPNVSRHGDVGIDCIQHNWSLALTLNKVLISVQSLLTDPYCLVCMEPTIGDLYVNNRYIFEEYARKWTLKYAMLDKVLY